jgi:hypothetical protein
MDKFNVTMSAVKSSNGYGAYDITELHYDADMNYMVDECGKVVYDIHRLVSPARLAVFKDHKQSTSVWDNHGDLVVLLYPDIGDRCHGD